MNPVRREELLVREGGDIRIVSFTEYENGVVQVLEDTENSKRKVWFQESEDESLLEFLTGETEVTAWTTNLQRRA